MPAGREKRALGPWCTVEGCIDGGDDVLGLIPAWAVKASRPAACARPM